MAALNLEGSISYWYDHAWFTLLIGMSSDYVEYSGFRLYKIALYHIKLASGSTLESI